MSQHGADANFRVARFTLLALAICAAHPAPAAPLTLDAAVERAVELAPQSDMRRAALESAQSQAISAGRLPDPALVLGIENLPVTGDDAGAFDADPMTMRRVGVMQEFPNGRKRASARERAQASVGVALSRSAQTRLEISRAAADAWLAAYVAEQTLARVRALEGHVELQAQAARAALASGRGSSGEALGAQALVSELKDRVLIAQRDAISARAELARWIGDSAHVETLAPPPAMHVLPAPRERLLAFERHAMLVEIDARVSLALSEVAAARAEKRPDVSVELSYGDRGAAFDDMASLEFRVGLPLFGATRQDPIVASRRAEVAALEAEREAELRLHEAEIHHQLAAWDAARERIELYDRERLPLARQLTHASLAGLEAGRVELSDALASQVNELELARERDELTLELGRAWTFLRYLQTEHGHE